jgi:hypothetical protein
MTETVVCIFPHANSEFASPQELISYLKKDLFQRKKKGQYLLRTLGFKDKDFIARVIKGSIVLFRKFDIVVGEAIVQQPIRKLEPPIKEESSGSGELTTYYHEVIFAQADVRIYKKPIAIVDLQKWANRPIERRFYSILGLRKQFEGKFAKYRAT